MRRILLVVLLLSASPGIALAEHWQARLSVLSEKSAPGCAAVANSGETTDGNPGLYILELTGDTLTGSGSTGKLFTTKVASDGSVDHRYKSVTGARLVISGNVKTRKLQITRPNAACVWELIPIAN